MKNIFKKNQIIITALAIMIAIAGYLNFSDRNNADKIADVGNGEVLDYDTYAETEGDNIIEGDTVSLQDTKDLLDETALDVTTDGETDTEDVLAEDTGKEDAAAEGTENTASADGKNKADTKAADASDKKSEEVAAYNVSDNGEVVIDEKGEETTAPGEAVLVSATTTPDFFASSKLAREQTRAINKEDLMAIVNSANLTEDAKAEAVHNIIEMTAIAEKENATETLLEAKGFSDAIVTIEGELVDVVVNATSLNEQDIAQITDIVKRKTGVETKDINIAPVVAGE
ncbi:MAG: SpoIIIAH-like family protein [Anaerocolumna sp.]